MFNKFMKLIKTLSITVFLLSFFSTADFAYTDKAEIVSLIGKVEVLKKDESQWIKAEKGMVLKPGDILLTGTNSECNLTFDSRRKNIVGVLGNSKIMILLAQSEKIEIIDADIYANITELAKGSAFEIRTPTAVCGARGTAFGIKANEESTEASSFESETYIRNKKGSEEGIKEGYKKNVGKDGKISKQISLEKEDIGRFKAWKTGIVSLISQEIKIIDIDIINDKKESQIIISGISLDDLKFEVISRKKFKIMPIVDAYCKLTQSIKPETIGLISKINIKYKNWDKSKNIGLIDYLEINLSKNCVIDVFEGEFKLPEGIIKVKIKLTIRPVYQTRVTVIEGSVYVSMLDMFGELTEQEQIVEEGESIVVGGGDGDGGEPEPEEPPPPPPPPPEDPTHEVPPEPPPPPPPPPPSS